MNSIIFILLIIITYLSIYFAYKKYGVKGLYILSIINVFLMNFIYSKQIDYNGIMINMDIFSLVTLLIVSNMIIQTKGYTRNKQYILEMIFIISTTYIALTLSSYLCSFNIRLKNEDYYKILFSVNIKHFLAINLSLFGGLFINSKLYYYLRKEKNIIWLSNFVSVIISQFIVAVVYILMMYINIYTNSYLIFMIVIRIILISSITMIYTKLIYNTQKLGGNNEN